MVWAFKGIAHLQILFATMADNHSEGECVDPQINPILESNLDSPQLLWITTTFDDDETDEEEGNENEQQPREQISRGRWMMMHKAGRD